MEIHISSHMFHSNWTSAEKKQNEMDKVKHNVSIFIYFRLRHTVAKQMVDKLFEKLDNLWTKQQALGF